jgi:hypothetical protein
MIASGSALIESKWQNDLLVSILARGIKKPAAVGMLL